MPYRFSVTQLNGAARRAIPEVGGCLDGIVRVLEAQAADLAMATSNGDTTTDNNTPVANIGTSETTPRHSNESASRKDPPPAKKRVLDVEMDIDNDVTIVTPQSSEILEDTRFELGYDSDGDLPDFGPVEEELAQMQAYNEAPAPEEEDLTPTADIEQQDPPATATSAFVLITEDAMKKLKVVELRSELRKRGLASSGNKPVLLERLQKAMAEKTPVLEEGTHDNTQEALNDDNFSSNAYWRSLDPTVDVVDPTKNAEDLHSPTEPAEASQRSQQPEKKSFPDSFDRPVFLGKVKVPQFQQNKRKKIDATTSEQVYKEEARVKGSPKLEWLKKHNLSPTSRPVDFFEAFVPEEVLDEWTWFTNTKAIMENAGKLGRGKKKKKIYPDFVPFDVRELKQHIGVRILHGISPSPRLEMKFKSQRDDEVNGNDFVYRNLGPNAARRHKHFRRFFTIQDPTLPKPKREERPNWKLERWFKHIQKVSQEAWECGIEISIDEQTLKFQGRHIHKLRISYKKGGGRIPM